MRRKRRNMMRAALIPLAAAVILTAGWYFLRDGPPARKGLVLMVDFPDMPGNLERSVVQDKFADMDDYLREMSYGRSVTSTEVFPRWIRAPRPVSHYRIPTADLKVKPGPIFDLTDDVIAEAGEQADLSRYDFIVFFLAAPVEDYGMVSLSGYPGIFGWKRDVPPRTRSGAAVDVPIAIYTRDAHLGSLVHDMAHLLGGWRGGRRVVPCLFDQDLQAEVGGRPSEARSQFLKAIPHLGFWCPLSCHFYKRFMPPPGFCAWTRLRLGWLEPGKVRTIMPGETAEVLLGPLARGDSKTLAIKIPVSGSRYYLIENRQRMGYDRFLPGRGVLVSLIDDEAEECMGGKTPVKVVDADPSVPLLEGAAFDIGGRETFSDPELGVTVRLAGTRGYSYLVSVEPYRREGL